MGCATIMTTGLPTLRADETVAAAAMRLAELKVSSLPGVDRESRYVGMFGVHVLLCLLVPRVALAGNVLPNLRFIGENMAALREAFHGLASLTVGEVADTSAPTLNPATPEIDAFRLFCQHHGAIAVIEPETRKLAGVVSGHDAMRIIAGK